jgi:hypothetical protein
MKPGATPGAAASAAWIEQQGLDVSRTPHWYVEITIPSDEPDTRFELNLYPEEWGIVFQRGSRVSSIRVTDIAFVHGLDDHRLISQVPPLERIHDLLGLIERRYDIALFRMRANVRSNLARAVAVVRPWLVGAR